LSCHAIKNIKRRADIPFTERKTERYFPPVFFNLISY